MAVYCIYNLQYNVFLNTGYLLNKWDTEMMLLGNKTRLEGVLKNANNYGMYF